MLLSLNQSSLRIQVDPKNPSLIRYRTELIVNGHSNLTIEKMRKLTIMLPRNPLKIFHFTNALADGKVTVPNTKDKNAKFECFATNGYAVAPFNYFDFFDPYNFETCRQKYSAQIVQIKPVNVQASSQKTVYPEFHELWKDNIINVSAAFNQGAKPWGENNFKNFVKNLRSAGYQVVQERDPQDIELIRTLPGRGNRQIRVRAYYRDSTDELYKILANGELKKSEVVFYSGHSGYGRFLEDLFNKNKNLPQRQYQMFFFLSCNSFSYGVSHIFANKALLDFDLDQYYADVISSTRSAYFHYFEPIMQLVIKFLEKSGELYGTPAIASQSYQNLIFAMDRLETTEKYKADWTIAGEERNRFNPSVAPASITAPEISASRLDEMFAIAFQEAVTKEERAALVSRAIQHEDPAVREIGSKQISKLNFDQFIDLMSDLDSDSDLTVAINSAINRYSATVEFSQRSQLLGLLARRYSSNQAAMKFIEDFLKSESDPTRIIYVLENMSEPDQSSLKQRHWQLVSRFLYSEYPQVEDAALCQLRYFNLNDQLFDAGLRKLDHRYPNSWRCALDLIAQVATTSQKQLATTKVTALLNDLLVDPNQKLPTDLFDAIWKIGPELIPLTPEVLRELKFRAATLEDYELAHLLRVVVTREGRRLDPILLEPVLKAAEDSPVDELYVALLELTRIDPRLLDIFKRRFDADPNRPDELIQCAILLAKFIPQDAKYRDFISSKWRQSPNLRSKAWLMLSNDEAWKLYPEAPDYAYALFVDPTAHTAPLFDISESTNSLPGVSIKLYAAIVLIEIGKPQQKSAARGYLSQVRLNPPSPAAYELADWALQTMR